MKRNNHQTKVLWSAVFPAPENLSGAPDIVAGVVPSKTSRKSALLNFSAGHNDWGGKRSQWPVELISAASCATGFSYSLRRNNGENFHTGVSHCVSNIL